MMNIPINDQLAITKLLLTDCEAVLSHLADPAIAASTVGIPWPYSGEDFYAMLAKAEAMEAEFGHPMYLAIRQAGGLLIGVIRFQEIVGEGGWEIGFWLAKSWWNQDIVTAGWRAACDLAFSRWDVGVIFASKFESNVASRRVLENNGFLCEGPVPLMKEGQRIAGWMYVLEAPPF